MTYSYRIEKAIRAAAVLHEDQVRKGRVPIPYVAHPVSVAYLLSEYTTDEDTIIAGLLHDTIEDTPYTFPELEEDFGVSVRGIVEEVTQTVDVEVEDPYDKRAWKARHAEYVSKLKKASEAALLVAAADKIHNMRSAIEEYADNHARFERDFGGTLEERLALYQSIANILNGRLKSDIVHEFNDVFEEYKKFIYAAQH